MKAFILSGMGSIQVHEEGEGGEKRVHIGQTDLEFQLSAELANNCLEIVNGVSSVAVML